MRASIAWILVGAAACSSPSTAHPGRDDASVSDGSTTAEGGADAPHGATAVDSGDSSPPDAMPADAGTPGARDSGLTDAAPDGGPRVLVTTVPDLTNGTWHHAHAVPTAVAMIQGFPGLTVTVSPDPQALVDLDPNQYDVLVFPAVGPWQLTSASLAAIASFVSAGRGFVGIHTAADTANYALGGGIDPVWYRDNLLGGLYWTGYPWLHDTIHRADTTHPSTATASMAWSDSPAFEDEMYAFAPLAAGKLHVLLTVSSPPIAVDPAGGTYIDAGDGGFIEPHPSSFCRQGIGAAGAGGRSWVTALGHMSGAPGEPGNTYAMPWFQDHVYQGILWAAGVTSGSCPDDNPPLVSP